MVLPLPPLLLHFTLVFPERPSGAARATRPLMRLLPALYLPALVLGAARIAVVARGTGRAKPRCSRAP